MKVWRNFVKKYPDKKLVLAGNMENKKYFNKVKKLASEAKNVKIKTNLNDKEITELYANCLAVIFIPFLEDFGIIPFEALALGKPLIAVDKGGYVKLMDGTSQFYKIKEVPSEEEMIKKINKGLEESFKSKKKIKTENKIKNRNFVKEMDSIIKEALK